MMIDFNLVLCVISNYINITLRISSQQCKKDSQKSSTIIEEQYNESEKVLKYMEFDVTVIVL